MNADLEARLERVALLGEPVRRALYRFVTAQAEPVNREQAAAGVGVARHVARFHLDRLVLDGLLEAVYRRPPGRGGPGAGRPAKFYRRSDVEVEVSLPERRYDLAGRLLVRAVSEADRTAAPVADVLRRVAHETGSAIGEQARSALKPRSGRRGRIESAVALLDDHGYEPCSGRGVITLSNCPFHRLAQEERQLVCGMNLAFVQGLLAGIGTSELDASLDPAPERCCVTLSKS